jgi:twinfilin-like protein
MSAPSGIRASDSLRTNFPPADEVRFLKVEIINELSMETTGQIEVGGSLLDDLDRVGELIQENVPTYILARSDEKSTRGTYKYILFCFVPDRAGVRGKMLYASSRTSLRQELGADHFVDEVFGTVLEDFTSQGYASYLEHKNSEAPLTEEEQMKKEERVHGVFEGGAGSSVAYVHGVQFAVAQEVLNALDEFAAGNVNYVQMSIDAQKEEIILNFSENQSVADLPNFVPHDEPRYHVFRWVHTHEGQDFNTVIYCFSCPDGSAGTTASPIKLRMLYATSKSNVTQLFEQRNIEVGLKLEICKADEFSEEELTNTLHPAKVEKKVVKKPTKSGGRGGRRIIRGKE